MTLPMGRPMREIFGETVAGRGSPRSAIAVANSSGLMVRVCQK